MNILDDLDQLLAAQIHANLWHDDPHYADRAARLGAGLSAVDWQVLIGRRALRDLSWMEKLAQTLADVGGDSALPLLEALSRDPEASVARIAREALEDLQP